MRDEGEEEEEAILTPYSLSLSLSLPFRRHSRSGLVLANRQRGGVGHICVVGDLIYLVFRVSSQLLQVEYDPSLTTRSFHSSIVISEKLS